MKAITYARAGDSSVLALVEREPRHPEVGEVRVRVVVSGVNPTDWKSRASSAPDGEKVPNQDGAGVVEEVGSGVEHVAVGDRVWLWDVAYRTTEGTAQESLTLPADHVVPLPDAESFDTGASLGIPALTAHLSLTAAPHGPAQLAPDSLKDVIVLVTGGAGAVGHAAIQLAAWAGAIVITTVSSPEKGELARRAGAHHVIDYRTQNVGSEVKRIAPAGAAIIVDLDLAVNIESDLAAIAMNGTIASYATASHPDVTLAIGPRMGANTTFRFVLTYTTDAAAKAHAIAGVSAALADGALRVGDEHGLPLTRFALADTAAAHDAVENGVVGKVLIDV